MHAFFLTRGNKDDVDKLVKFLETRVLPMNYIDKDGNKGQNFQTGILQPIQLWSFVFPEEHKDAVLTALKFTKANKGRWLRNAKSKVLAEGLRVALGAEPIPEFKEIPKGQGIYLPVEALQNISIIPIGTKKDAYMFHDDGKFHEAL